MGIPQNQEIHRVIRSYLQKLPDKNENMLGGKGYRSYFSIGKCLGFANISLIL